MAPERSLLDRLNALKPTTIALGESSQARPLDAKPAPTRDDGLASRLRALRLAREDQQDRQEQQQQDKKDQKELQDQKDRQDRKQTTTRSIAGDWDDDAHEVDMGELLADMAGGQGVDDDGDSDDEFDFALPDVPTNDWLSEDHADTSDDEGHTKQVEALLQKLAGTPLKAVDPKKDGVDLGDSDSDDSDGQDMGRAIRDVLERAKDEAALAPDAGEPEPEPDEPDEPTDALGMPAVPTAIKEPPGDDTLGLPPAPTDDPPPRGGDDDISQRLAALRGLRGPSTGLGQTDAFGLPSAPTFRPGDEGGVLKRGHFGFGRANYSDADAQTWCIVCLEDADVRCIGCADSSADGHAKNAYCHACWRDMHVGPAAGFDERGHKRVPMR